MKQATREWIKKAKGDYVAATILARRRKVPLHDQVCFHCQQCAEKYLKARLEEANIRIPKTHDLEVLLDLALSLEPLWSVLRPSLEKLSDYAVEFRYPGHEAKCENCTRHLQGGAERSEDGAGIEGVNVASTVSALAHRPTSLCKSWA